VAPSDERLTKAAENLCARTQSAGVFTPGCPVKTPVRDHGGVARTMRHFAPLAIVIFSQTHLTAIRESFLSATRCSGNSAAEMLGLPASEIHVRAPIHDIEELLIFRGADDEGIGVSPLSDGELVQLVLDRNHQHVIL